MSINPYKVLEVGRRASPERIKAAHRRMAKECHPDKHPGDDAALERWKLIQEAFEVLIDPMKRAFFDTHGVMPHKGPANEHVPALKFLSSVTHEVLRKLCATGHDPQSVDLIQQIRAEIMKLLDLSPKTIAGLEKTRAMLEAVSKRVVAPEDEENLLASIVMGPVAQINEQIAGETNARHVADQALKLLAKYKYTRDGRLVGPSGTSSTSGGFAQWATR